MIFFDPMLRACVLMPDGRVMLRDVLGRERRELLEDGFRPFAINLTRDDATSERSALWAMTRPTLPKLLEAARLVFGEDPGSISFDESPD